MKWLSRPSLMTEFDVQDLNSTKRYSRRKYFLEPVLWPHPLQAVLCIYIHVSTCMGNMYPHTWAHIPLCVFGSKETSWAWQCLSLIPAHRVAEACLVCTVSSKVILATWICAENPQKGGRGELSPQSCPLNPVWCAPTYIVHTSTERNRQGGEQWASWAESQSRNDPVGSLVLRESCLLHTTQASFHVSLLYVLISGWWAGLCLLTNIISKLAF